MESPPRSSSNLTTWIVGIVLVIILAAIAVPGLLSSQRVSNERSASAILKTITSAEADFRGNDRDKNGVQDFWTKDVAGLFDLVPAGETEPIQLISPHLAKADPTRSGGVPMPGYWFTAMDQDEEGKDYRQGPGKDRHPSKFGFRAYPADRSTGRNEFYINEDNQMFKKSSDLPPLRAWPKKEEVNIHYGPLD